MRNRNIAVYEVKKGLDIDYLIRLLINMRTLDKNILNPQ